jgi:hypothetical protein
MKRAMATGSKSVDDHTVARDGSGGGQSSKQTTTNH